MWKRPFMQGLPGTRSGETPDPIQSAFPVADSMASLSSPFSCICCKISLPPKNSPPTYTCGKVGQSEKSLTPCRTSGSKNTSKWVNSCPYEDKMEAARAEKPHWGLPGLPFMNRTILLSPTSSCRYSCTGRSPLGDSGSGGGLQVGVGRLGGAVVTGARPGTGVATRSNDWQAPFDSIPYSHSHSSWPIFTLTGVAPTHSSNWTIFCPNPPEPVFFARSSSVVHFLPLGGHFGSPLWVSTPAHLAQTRFYRGC